MVPGYIKGGVKPGRIKNRATMGGSAVYEYVEGLAMTCRGFIRD